jgi:predicted GNAT family acetyltransferase
LASDIIGGCVAIENQPITVEDNPAENRFEATVDGRVAVAEYMRSGQTIIFTHTEVPPQLRGRGIATALARAALDQARAQGLVVVARCKIIAQFVASHPEYQSLLRQPTSQP